MTSESNVRTVDVLVAALERIAAPRRPDGTYNLSREACEEVAVNALRVWEGSGERENDPSVPSL